MDASVRLFAENGYEKTSINQLARAAGIGKGTVYTYFKTKREILLAFCEEELDFINAEVARHSSEEADFLERILTVFVGTFRFSRQHRDFGRIMLRESFFPSDLRLDQSRRMEERYFRMLTPILQQGQQRGELRPDLEFTLVIGHFYGLFLVVMSAWYTDRLRSEDDVVQGLRSLFEQALTGLGPR